MELAANSAAPTPGNDRWYMDAALDLARHAACASEVPIGAVVVLGDRIVGRGCNASIELNDPTAHAEVLALRAAARQIGNYRLPGATIYVTVEPCLMCVGALLHSRVRRVVFGCREPKGGALGSVYNGGADDRGNHRLEVVTGVAAEEACAIMQRFFRERRGA